MPRPFFPCLQSGHAIYFESTPDSAYLAIVNHYYFYSVKMQSSNMAYGGFKSSSLQNGQYVNLLTDAIETENVLKNS